VWPDRRCPIPLIDSGLWPLFGGAKLLGLDIWHGVDRLGTYENEYLHGVSRLYQGVLIRHQSYHRDMRVPLVLSLCQVVMG
jgi:hypothetical protein